MLALSVLEPVSIKRNPRRKTRLAHFCLELAAHFFRVFINAFFAVASGILALVAALQISSRVELKQFRCVTSHTVVILITQREASFPIDFLWHFLKIEIFLTVDFSNFLWIIWQKKGAKMVEMKASKEREIIDYETIYSAFFPALSFLSVSCQSLKFLFWWRDADLPKSKDAFRAD